MTSRPKSSGYTLVEILVALTLTLMLMTVVVRVFGGVGDGIRKSRSALEQNDRLRTAALQLKQDLGNVTARPDGRAARPEEAPGYLEIVEGSYQFVNAAGGSNAYPYYGIDNSTGSTSVADYTVGERGDMIMFTARNAARPYVGRYGYSAGNPQTIQSDVAEICWFLRGNRLHRRALLVVPGAAAAVSSYSPAAFYNDYDLSAHMQSGKIVPNSLADLTKRENRFGHDARGFPFDVRGWGTYGLPTLAECTSSWMSGSSWVGGSTPPPKAGPSALVDMWDNSPSGLLNTNFPDQALGTNGARVADDVILNNVLEFDVKVWEPAANSGAGGYVDLGATATGTISSPVKLANFTTPQGPTIPRFNNGGIQESGLSTASGPSACVYDTGCFAYLNELGNSQATNGLDDGGIAGVVDDTSEAILPNGYAPGISPYPVPLRGIQIKIRCFDPDSRQIREISIENDFLPK